MRIFGLIFLFVFAIPLCMAESREAAGWVKKLDIPVSSDKAVQLDLSSGQVNIKAATDDRLTALMAVGCPAGDDECVDRVKNSIDFSVSHDEDRIIVTTDRRSVFGDRDSHVSVTFYVPESQSLGVAMLAGELTISPIRSCLNAEVTAGRVDVTVSRALVASVNLATTFGEVSLFEEGERRNGERMALVGARLGWYEGRGACEVNVHVVSGEIVATVEDGAS